MKKRPHLLQQFLLTSFLLSLFIIFPGCKSTLQNNISEIKEKTEEVTENAVNTVNTTKEKIEETTEEIDKTIQSGQEVIKKFGETKEALNDLTKNAESIKE